MQSFNRLLDELECKVSKLKKEIVPESKIDKELWREWHARPGKPNIYIGGKKKVGESFSGLFFKEFELAKYLNTQCRSMLQLGASKGNFLADYQKAGWNVVGFDHVEEAQQAMAAKNIPCELVDLNELDEEKKHLKCQDKLVAFTSRQTNIVAVRVLEYLEENALTALLFGLMNAAAPGSTFFIVSLVSSDKAYAKNTKKPNFLASYFAARTDFFTLFHHRTHDKFDNPSCLDDNPDEIIVVRNGF